MLFAKYNYSEVNIRMIAREAGITSAAIYNHYESKDELFKQTVLRMMNNTRSMLSQVMGEGGHWKERFEKILFGLGEDLKSSPGIQILSSTTQIKMARDPEKYEAMREARTEIGQVFRTLVQEAVDSGDLPESTRVEIAGDLLMAFCFNAIGAVTLHWNSQDYMDSIVESFKNFTQLGLAEKRDRKSVS
tara:strand:- start:15 stop:581 length:567 start_codon:yes stop_codon:yes gene_type:complete